MANVEKIGRIIKANEFVQIIASHGHQFFQYNNNGTPQFGYFELNSKTGHLFWYTERRDAKIYVRKGEWSKFEHGMTLQCFIYRLAEYIRTGRKLCSNYFHNWGFNNELSIIIDKGREFCIIEG